MISDLLGKTLANVYVRGDDELIFTLNTGEKYKLHHYQECCERVYIADIIGDLKDLIGSPILMAEEVIHESENPPGIDSFTWTFYKLATVRGYVTVRWYGASNGFYSESVSWSKEHGK
jgi:hypothetical protein